MRSARSVPRIVARTLIAPLVAGAVVLCGGLLACGESPQPAGSTTTVTSVVDGDTVVLAGIGRARLIGVDTPEVHGFVECFGREASTFAKGLLAGRRVRWERGAEPRDRYGRALVYLWLSDGRFVNEQLAAGGYARTLEIAPNVRFAARLRTRERAARAAGRGLWSRGACG